MSDSSLLQDILQRARWAPSGDNTQPWRFELVDAAHLAVHGFDTRDHVLYDFDGRASQLAHGALLETIRLAASCHGMRVEWRVRPDCPETTPIYDVRLVPEDHPRHGLHAALSRAGRQGRRAVLLPASGTAQGRTGM